MQNSRSESLCSACTSIPLRSYFQPNYPASTPATREPYEYPEPGAHDLLDEILSRRRTCNLCRLIADAIHSAVNQHHHSPIPDPEESDSTDIHALLRVPIGAKLRCYIRPEPIELLESESHLVPNQAFRIAITLRLDEKSEAVRNTAEISRIKATIQVLGSSAEMLNTTRPYLGRAVGSSFDIELLRHWFNICANNHAHTTPSTKKPPSPLIINLIDIQGRRIMTTGPESGYIQYAALSYTWGGDQRYKLLRDNLAQWTTPNGLPDFELLPRTIKDALQLTKELGQRYLWVDALCIVQDDPPSRNIQLSQMNWIYELAQFTIVAAAGSDAEAGLPGLAPHSRRVFQVTETIEGIDLAVPFPTLETTIASTKWNTRGWTYQEQLLSSTLVIFTPHQVYFQCDRKVFQEDVHIELEGRLRNITWTYPGLQLSMGMERLNTFRTSSLFIHEGSPIGISERYRKIVVVYTKRDFGNTGDMLAGFIGLTNAFQRASGSMGYVGGLSVAGFEDSLLWVHCGPLVRRRDLQGKKLFPSWSFMGWVGSCQIEWISDPESPIVQEWFAVHRSPLSVSATADMEVRTRLPIVTYNALHFRDCRPKTGPFSSIGDGSWDVAHSHAVEFKSVIATFRVSRLRRHYERGFPVLSRRNTSDKSQLLATFCILNDKEQWIGTVMLPDNQTSALSASEGVQQDFLLISARGAPVGCYADPSLYSQDWKKGLNVMMVEKTPGGEMERLAVGIVHKDAWDAAETREQHVRLI